jgi:exonuclease SbcC
VALNERSVALESQISEARHRLETEREVVERRIAELEGRLPSEALLDEHTEVQAQLEHLTQLAESREAARDDLARIAEERAGLRAHNEALRQEMEALKEKLTLLEKAADESMGDTSAVDPSARAQCPLCEQSLTEEHRQRVVEQVKADGKARGNAYRANRVRVKQLGEQAQALERQIADSESLLQQRAALQRREAALNERIEQGKRAAEELEDVREDLVALDRRLAEEDYALDVRAELRDVLAQAEELGYDAEAHDAARRAVSEKQIFAERKAQLETAQERREEEREALERLGEAEQRWQEQVEQAQARKAELEAEADGLRGQLENAEAVEEELQRVREAAAAAHRKLGAAQQRLAACEAYEGQRADKLKRKKELAEKAGIYDELRTAFGVRGVPAMIIEAAVPEIEDEANRLLTQMTSGRMHVRFDTQRETKAGEVREALEIKIADELGTRPYENYSGGEQFRVNFAIRIALSKLLARRAGAQLQTLVIDEGFGTQDAQGRQRLVEAINAIQDDFARVLVITHIDELKDAFPVRIEVAKTPTGSVVDVV